MNLADKQAANAAKQSEQKIKLDRTAQAFAQVFSSEDGQIVMDHLWKRFDIEGRTFIGSEGGSVDPLRAAIRDGERAAIAYIFNTVKKANPKQPHP